MDATQITNLTKDVDELCRDLRGGGVPLDQFRKSFNEAWAKDQNVTREAFEKVAIVAAAKGRADIVDDLLTMKFSLNGSLYWAAKNGRSIAVFKILYKHGWELNDPCMPGKLPILGFIAEDWDLINWFLDNGADLNIENAEGITPLSYAVMSAPLTTIPLFFEKGGRIDKGWLLNHAVRRKSEVIEVVEYLLDILEHYGKDKREWLNKVMYDGKPPPGLFLGISTPLIEVVASKERNDQEKAHMVGRLIKLGANPLIPDTMGRNALDYARNKPVILQSIEVMASYYTKTSKDSP